MHWEAWKQTASPSTAPENRYHIAFSSWQHLCSAVEVLYSSCARELLAAERSHISHETQERTEDLQDLQLPTSPMTPPCLSTSRIVCWSSPEQRGVTMPVPMVLSGSSNVLQSLTVTCIGERPVVKKADSTTLSAPGSITCDCGVSTTHAVTRVLCKLER